jgi:ADP-ribose pyrophosphatase
MTDAERQLSSRSIYAGRTFNVRVDRVALSAGGETDREVVEHRGSAVLLARENGQILLVRQYRYAVGAVLLELPAGTIDAGEDAAQTAARELAEEVGRAASRLTPIAELLPSPGFLTERMHFFVADGLSPAFADGDEDESIEVVTLPWEEALTMARGGRFRDMKTVVGILLLDALDSRGGAS